MSLSSFLNIMFVVLLVENVSPLLVDHASNLFSTPCNVLVVTLWFLVIIYIARSSAKYDPFAPFSSSPRMLLISSRKRVTLSTLPVKFPELSICSVM